MQASAPLAVAAVVAGRHRRSAWLVGAFNGFFVAVLRLQSIVVTLSTMFIVQGITLLVMDKPGGAIAPEFVALLHRRRDSQRPAGAGRGAGRSALAWCGCC